jgi:hypothetical protein
MIGLAGENVILKLPYVSHPLLSLVVVFLLSRRSNVESGPTFV